MPHPVLMTLMIRWFDDDDDGDDDDDDDIADDTENTINGVACDDI